MINKRILFRADAKPEIGTGDLMSLINLSHNFERDGWECHFMIKNYKTALKIVEKHNLKNLSILNQNNTIMEEVAQINNFNKRNDIDLIFFEITENPLSAYQGISNQTYKACVSFDGKILPDMDLVIDWDVDAHIFFDLSKYPDTIFLLGPEFVILPYDFDFNLIEKRKLAASNENLLICMGGADEFNYTQKIVNLLVKNNINYNTKIIIGAGYRYQKELETYLAKFRLRHSIKRNVANMFEEYLNCNIAIGTGGLTVSELVATKTPSIIIATYEHQIARCKFFNNLKLINFLGYRTFTEKQLLNAIKNPIIPQECFTFNTSSILKACNEIIKK